MSMKAGFTPTENGQTPLFNAARHGHRDIVNRLCDARAPLAATERPRGERNLRRRAGGPRLLRKLAPVVLTAVFMPPGSGGRVKV